MVVTGTIILQWLILLIYWAINLKRKRSQRLSIKEELVPPRLLLSVLATTVMPASQAAGQMVSTPGASLKLQLLGGTTLALVGAFGMGQALLLLAIGSKAWQLGVVYGTFGEYPNPKPEKQSLQQPSEESQSDSAVVLKGDSSSQQQPSSVVANPVLEQLLTHRLVTKLSGSVRSSGSIILSARRVSEEGLDDDNTKAETGTKARSQSSGSVRRITSLKRVGSSKRHMSAALGAAPLNKQPCEKVQPTASTPAVGLQTDSSAVVESSSALATSSHDVAGTSSHDVAGTPAGSSSAGPLGESTEAAHEDRDPAKAACRSAGAAGAAPAGLTAEAVAGRPGQELLVADSALSAVMQVSPFTAESASSAAANAAGASVAGNGPGLISALEPQPSMSRGSVHFVDAFSSKTGMTHIDMSMPSSTAAPQPAGLQPQQQEMKRKQKLEPTPISFVAIERPLKKVAPAASPIHIFAAVPPSLPLSMWGRVLQWVQGCKPADGPGISQAGQASATVNIQLDFEPVPDRPASRTEHNDRKKAPGQQPDAAGGSRTAQAAPAMQPGAGGQNSSGEPDSHGKKDLDDSEDSDEEDEAATSEPQPLFGEQIILGAASVKMRAQQEEGQENMIGGLAAMAFRRLKRWQNRSNESIPDRAGVCIVPVPLGERSIVIAAETRPTRVGKPGFSDSLHVMCFWSPPYAVCVVLCHRTMPVMTSSAVP